MAKAKALFAKLAGKKGGKDDRTEEQKDRDKLAAIAEAEKASPAEGFDEEAVRSQLGPIKSRYKLLTLDLVVEDKKERTETVHFSASASKKVDGKALQRGRAAPLNLVVLSKPFVARDKKATKKRLAMTKAHFREQVLIQQNALCDLTVGVWQKNWAKFHPPEDSGEEGGRWDEDVANTAPKLRSARNVPR